MVPVAFSKKDFRWFHLLRCILLKGFQNKNLFDLNHPARVKHEQHMHRSPEQVAQVPLQALTGGNKQFLKDPVYIYIYTYSQKNE